MLSRIIESSSDDEGVRVAMAQFAADSYLNESQLNAIYTDPDTEIEVFDDKGSDTQGFVMKFKVITDLSSKPSAVVAFRGTSTGQDILTDIDYKPITFDNPNFSSETKVCTGVNKAWHSVKSFIIEILDTWVKHQEIGSIFITGHSLGGALSKLAAADIAYNYNLDVTNISFASPNVGNEDFNVGLDGIGRLKTANYLFANDQLIGLANATLATLTTYGFADCTTITNQNIIGRSESSANAAMTVSNHSILYYWDHFLNIKDIPAFDENATLNSIVLITYTDIQDFIGEGFDFPRKPSVLSLNIGSQSYTLNKQVGNAEAPFRSGSTNVFQINLESKTHINQLAELSVSIGDNTNPTTYIRLAGCRIYFTFNESEGLNLAYSNLALLQTFKANFKQSAYNFYPLIRSYDFIYSQNEAQHQNQISVSTHLLTANPGTGPIPAFYDTKWAGIISPIGSGSFTTAIGRYLILMNNPSDNKSQYQIFKIDVNGEPKAKTDITVLPENVNYTNMTSFEYEGKKYAYFYKKSSGNAVFYEITKQGQDWNIDKHLYFTDDSGDGYDVVVSAYSKAFKFPYIVFYQESPMQIKCNRINIDNPTTNLFKEKDWNGGSALISVFDHKGDDYLVIYYSDKGYFKFEYTDFANKKWTRTQHLDLPKSGKAMGVFKTINGTYLYLKYEKTATFYKVVGGNKNAALMVDQQGEAEVIWSGVLDTFSLVFLSGKDVSYS